MTSFANAATKMIWGEQNEEPGTQPVSGRKGKGTLDEPYDAGNKGGTVSDASPINSPVDQPPSVTGMASDAVNTNEGPQKSPDTNKAGGFSNVESSVKADPASAPQQKQKQQGGDRPMEEPVSENVQASKEEKDEGEEAIKKRDPNDHSGEPMKMHDGSGKEDQNNSSSEKDDKTEEGKKSEGTGEKWIKTSGLEAEGGNFDATKPGAGREADRLLEEKGVHHGSEDAKSSPKVGDSKSPSNTSKIGRGSSPSSDKVSKMGRIKEKFHIGKSNK